MIISLITALIEFCILAYLIILFLKSRIKTVAIASAMVFLLASYQFSEFILSVTAFAEQWARIGFAIYSFIPAVAFSLFQSLSKKKVTRWIYVFPVFFVALSLFYPGFIVESSCKIFHVSVSSFVFRENVFFLTTYLSYYSFFSIYGVYIFSRSATKTLVDTLKLRIAIILMPLAPILGVLFFIIYNLKHSIIQESDAVVILAVTSIMLVITAILSVWMIKPYGKFLKTSFIFVLFSFVLDLILYILFVQFSYDFSSIWCHFAFLYSISCLIFTLSVVNNKKFRN